MWNFVLQESVGQQMGRNEKKSHFGEMDSALLPVCKG